MTYFYDNLFLFVCWFFIIRVFLLYILCNYYFVIELSLIVYKYGKLIIIFIFVYMNYHLLQLVISVAFASIVFIGAIITFKTSKN